MRKSLIWILIVAVLVVAVGLRIFFGRRGKRIVEGAQRPTVEVVLVTKGTVQSTCEVLGVILADKTAQVFPEAMGRVTRIMVKEGTPVGKDIKIMAIKNETVGFDYEEGFVRAPIAGEVAKVMVDVGAMVTPQVPVAVVVDYATVKASFNLSERDVRSVVKGKNLLIEVDALAGNSIRAQVSEISPVIDPLTRTSSVKASINNNRRLLKPGMTARIKIILAEKRNVLAIPKDAIIDGFVFVAKDSLAEKRAVKVGLIGDRKVEIIDGLEESELVVTVGQERLAGSEKVNPVERGER